MTATERLQYVRNRKFPFAVLDIFILSAVLVLTVTLSLTVFGDDGLNAEIVYGETRIVLPLGENTRMRVGGVLTVEIKDGKCRVTESDCKRHTCVKTGEISRVGESIICAQFGVIITVTGFDGLAASVGQG